MLMMARNEPPTDAMFSPIEPKRVSDRLPAGTRRRLLDLDVAQFVDQRLVVVLQAGDVWFPAPPAVKARTSRSSSQAPKVSSAFDTAHVDGDAF